MLEALGLDAIAEQVYQALLVDPDTGVKALGETLALPESQVREALDRLLDLDLLRPSCDAPERLRPVSPQVGLEAIVARQERALAEQQLRLAVSRLAAAKAITEFGRYHRGTVSASIETLLGADAVRDRLEVLLKGSREECLVVLPGRSREQMELTASEVLERRLPPDGVGVRLLVQESVRRNRTVRRYVQRLIRPQDEMRTAVVSPPWMLVVDWETALVPIDPAAVVGALCVRERGIVGTLAAVFEAAWATATPLDVPRPACDAALTASDTGLLNLLATGITDEAAAKRLGVSLRTVRRQMSALMERLGASSRFEAGFKVAQHGWI
ncbi:helix-turn-helix transcriptional regulator [Streptomyces sp. NPDC020801]|uniref:helix-turn-helix transcriptional regulator n=1 Tax=Streptomyces sp. NPDC020801 TaxID=3365093 RepID=UPI0037872ED5